MNDGNNGNNYTNTFVPDATGTITARRSPSRRNQHQDLRRDDERRDVAGHDVRQLARGHVTDMSETYTAERGHGQDADAGGSVKDGNDGNNYTTRSCPSRPE